MPKSNCQRTFTACWTCRRRNVRCDKAVPHCRQCRRMRIECEGYHIQLVWVDSKTGAYAPQQRRAYPCELTWKGYPYWSLKEVCHLIDSCEHQRCPCQLHTVPNPFCVFPSKREPTENSEEREPSPQGTPDTITDDQSVDEKSIESTTEIGDTLDNIRTESDVETSRRQQIVRRRSSFGNRAMPSISIASPLLQSYMPSENHTENRLFHHYVQYVSLIMIPIDDGRNPWKSTYPSIAVQDMSLWSTRSLYHAILAQSAFNIANLKGSHEGSAEKSLGMQYFGMALRELRESLTTPIENYSSVLAALLTVTIVEDVFLGKSRGWRHHFRGALEFVIQYLHQQPWLLSRDAWIITQNFALSNVIAQTVGKCSISTDTIGAIYRVLSDVMVRSNFGFTIGGTARLIKSVYQIRLLEERMLAAGCHGAHDMDSSMTAQADEILQQLQTPLVQEVEVYLEQQESVDIMMLPRTRTLVNLHLRLFNSAVIIYLLRMVLQYPPSAVVEYVTEVLADTVAFIELHGGSVSIWPVFIAAVEAYNSELQALARRFLDFSTTLGVGNRDDVTRVVLQVWSERERRAMELHCDPGDVIIDWREVMKDLDLDILLL